MPPLNHLINYSSELTKSPSFFAKNVASRFVTAAAIPFELLAVLENAIKLPFQTTAAIVKIPAKIVNVFVDSMSLKEFESKLSNPLDVVITAIKIAGFAIGLLFTSTLGLISPHENFRLHCSLSLIDNHHAKKLIQQAKENKQKEIDSYEKIIEGRLRNIVDAMRQQSQLVTFLTPEQRQEIETLTGVNCPSIEAILNDVDDTCDVNESNEIAADTHAADIEIKDDLIVPTDLLVEDDEIADEVCDDIEEIIPENNLTPDESSISQIGPSVSLLVEESAEPVVPPVDHSLTIIPFESKPSEVIEENPQAVDTLEFETDERNELVNGY